jgi:glycosyltransferase involved in cell wall biosynthesis
MLHAGDAVGRHALRIRSVLQNRGIRSQIYVESVDRETASDTEPYQLYAQQAKAGDVLVYQFATASGLAPWLLTRSEPVVLNYHNVTPPEHFAPWDNGLARHQLAAQVQLRAMAPRARLGIAVSRFNEAELRAAGCTRTAVVPPAAMLEALSAPSSQRAPTGQGARWVSVGRLAPNKALQHAIMALLVSRRHYDARSTLELVGRPVLAAYTDALHRFIDDMGLHEAVIFRGQLDDARVAQCMAEADVMVVPSAHEGFGLPVVEAMTQGLPVVANAAGALPDIVGRGGFLVDTSDPWRFAAAVARVLSDRELQAAMSDGAQRQLAELDLPSAADRMADLLSSLA